MSRSAPRAAAIPTDLAMSAGFVLGPLLGTLLASAPGTDITTAFLGLAALALAALAAAGRVAFALAKLETA